MDTISTHPVKSYKTLVQEIVQKDTKQIPEYREIEEEIDNINVYTGEGTQYLNKDGRQNLMMMLNKTFVMMKNGNIYIPDNPCRILVEDRIRYKYTSQQGGNPKSRSSIFYTAGNDEKFAIEIFSLKID